VEIEVLGGYGGQSPECRMTCLLLNGRIALDAGCLAQVLPVARQAEVHSILLTHSHIDHVNSLPFFIDNIYALGPGRVDIYAAPATVHAVRRHLFNNAFWPDFARLPHNLLPTVRFHELADEVPVEIGDLRVTPVPVTHVVPTYGFLIEDGASAVLWSSDTGPTVRFWELANETPRLRALFVETSFDDARQRLAEVSLHLTPRSLARELHKLERRLPIVLHHLKPPCVEAIRAEVVALDLPGVEFIEQDRTYRF
jgi:ribonuclease BN (tRNA processing enzyme)